LKPLGLFLKLLRGVLGAFGFHLGRPWVTFGYRGLPRLSFEILEV